MKATIGELAQAHRNIADRLDISVPGQNDFRFALLGAVSEIGEALQHLPWRPWRTLDQRVPSEEDISDALPELIDAMSAILRACINLGVTPQEIEDALWAHVEIKHHRLDEGFDK
jgi:hypothetical protein